MANFRAWYGLGQTYELLKMPYYCLYYYKQVSRRKRALNHGFQVQRVPKYHTGAHIFHLPFGKNINYWLVGEKYDDLLRKTQI